jgi:mycofactocin precursor
VNEFENPQTVDAPEPEGATVEQLIEADDLIEEVSIDGMCGVY